LLLILTIKYTLKLMLKEFVEDMTLEKNYDF